MSSIQTNRINRIIQSLERKYDPENDVILVPGAPSVTKADIDLVECIKALVIVVEDLQASIDGIYQHEARGGR